jgi:hypothetical protein
MLPSGSGDQFCDPLPALHWRWLISVFVYWEFSTGSLFLCLAPLSLGYVQCANCLFRWLCLNTVHCLFFSFVVQFGFGWCSLAQETISVIHYPPCFRECLFTHLLSVFTAFPVFLYW